MQIHQLKPTKKRKRKKRIGRGGKRGTYSGRGIKGQKSRAGRRIRPQLRDVLKKLPKRRGYGVARISPNLAVINLEKLEKNFEKGATVSPEVLVTQGLIRRISGRAPAIKILGQGKLSKVLIIKDCFTSKSAAAAIKKAGGSITLK